MPVILATQEAEIRRIMVQSQPRILKKPITKKGLVEWLKVKALSLSPSTTKKKKKKKKLQDKEVFLSSCHQLQFNEEEKGTNVQQLFKKKKSK
jgi:hypothetical protein